MQNIVDPRFGSVRHGDLTQVNGFQDPGLGAQDGAVKQSTRHLVYLVHASVSWVGVYECVHDVKSASSEVFADQHSLLADLLESIHDGVFDFLKALYLFRCIHNDIAACVLRAEPPQLPHLFFVPAEIRHELVLQLLVVHRRANLSLFNAICQFIREGLHFAKETVQFVVTFGDADRITLLAD